MARLVKLCIILFLLNSVGAKCFKKFSIFVSSLERHEEWAVRMFDAYSKFPSGILGGNIADMGAFDQCLDVENEKKGIKGQYCLGKIILPTRLIKKLDMKRQTPVTVLNRAALVTSDSPGLNLAFCVPDICKPYEIMDVLSPYLNKILRFLEMDASNMSVDPAFCQTKETKPVWKTGDFAVVLFFVFVLFVVLFSTFYDMTHVNSNVDKTHVILTAFSAYTNTKRIFTVGRNNSSKLQCLNGIRFISMMWVIIGHKFTVSIMRPSINLLEAFAWTKKAEEMYIIGADVSVDTFFLLSGLLISFGFMKTSEDNVSFNFLQYYIHRYIRLTPALAAVVLFHATILNLIGSGPYWPLVYPALQKPCEDYWWSTLLYIQNFVNPELMCIAQSWYLSVDTQLYILSPLVLIPLRKWPSAGIGLCCFLVLVSIATPFAISYIYQIPGSIMNASDNVNFMTKYYFQTHSRFGPWIIGIMLGYFIYKQKQSKTVYIMSTWMSFLGWASFITVLTIVVFAPHNLFVHPYDRLETAFFNSFHRQAWAVGICWVIYACSFGIGGPINWFLSLSIFQIMSKFTYSMYLTHLTIQYLWAATSRIPGHFSDIENFYTFWGDFMFTLFFSVCLTLGFESPMMVLEKVFLTTRYPRIKTTSVQDAVREELQARSNRLRDDLSTFSISVLRDEIPTMHKSGLEDDITALQRKYEY